ncbi:unnamed protein product, partial [Meganyctiphanes norvegica]
DELECTICNNIFDDATHRPRSLPCGHGFCTFCIEKYIVQGNKACPVCRKEHGAKSASDLPVCFLLEEFLQKAAISSCQKLKLDSDTVKATSSSCQKLKLDSDTENVAISSLQNLNSDYTEKLAIPFYQKLELYSETKKVAISSSQRLQFDSDTQNAAISSSQKIKLIQTQERLQLHPLKKLNQIQTQKRILYLCAIFIKDFHRFFIAYITKSKSASAVQWKTIQSHHVS